MKKRKTYKLKNNISIITTRVERIKVLTTMLHYSLENLIFKRECMTISTMIEENVIDVYKNLEEIELLLGI